MKRIIISTLICLIASHGFAQNSLTDSLKAILPKTTDRYEKYQLLEQINSEYYKVGTGEGSLTNAFKMVRIATDLKNDSLIAKAYNGLGGYYELTKGDFNADWSTFLKEFLIGRRLPLAI